MQHLVDLVVGCSIIVVRPPEMNALREENERTNKRMCIYILHISSHGGLQLLLSEIECQLVKASLATAISSYLISLTHPTHA